MTPEPQSERPMPPQSPEMPLPSPPPEVPLPPQRPEMPIEQRGAAEVIAVGAAVVSALPAAIQVGGQVKDKLTKK